MSRRNAYMFLRFVYLVLDHTLSSLFGLQFRQKFIRMSFRIKTTLFPEYGDNIPAQSEVGPMPHSIVWMPPVIPEWVLDEMRILANEIDPILYPTDQFLSKCQYYSYPVLSRPGVIYRELMANCSSDHYTHCFAIPWLKPGGADLVSLKHIELASKMQNCKVMVLLTEPGESSWLSRIPEGVDVLDASRYVGNISHDELLLVLARVLIQLQIDTLHIINSRHVWEIICRYGLALTQKTKVFASLYCDDYDQHGMPVGFARQYLPDCYRWLTNVFTDNKIFPALLCQTYGYRGDLFKVLQSPVGADNTKTPTRAPKGRRVLWAGRLDRQKRPDLLLAIALALPDIEFHVYGHAVLEKKGPVLVRLQELKNVRMFGGFDGVESLPFSEFPVYLYTSQWDGTPTMVIAAALASIPIVASGVGGVLDIVSNERGYPVEEYENVQSYVDGIMEALDNHMLAETKALTAREYVKYTYSDFVFSQSLMSIPGYMPLDFVSRNSFDDGNR